MKMKKYLRTAIFGAMCIDAYSILIDLKRRKTNSFKWVGNRQICYLQQTNHNLLSQVKKRSVVLIIRALMQKKTEQK